MPEHVRKKIMSYLLIALLIYGIVIGFLFLSQRDILYYPMGEAIAPSDVEVVSTNLQKDRGYAAPKGWHIPPTAERRKVILHFHGNAGNISHRLDLMLPFVDDGYGVLLAEYSGYGGNEGSPSEESIFLDAEGYYQTLLSLGYKSDEIILFGESLGSGPATYLAEKYDANALILQVPYDSVLNVAKAKYPFILGMRFLLKDHFDNLSRISNINMPLFILAAENDGIIPVKHAKNLFESASMPKLMAVAEAIGHNDIYPDLLYNEVTKFLKIHNLHK